MNPLPSPGTFSASMRGGGAASGEHVGGAAVALAALLIASVPLGSVATVTLGGGSIGVSWTMIVLALAMGNAAVGHLTRASVGGTSSKVFRAAVAATALAFIPTTFSSGGPAAFAAYLNFVIGVWAGYFIGRAWGTLRLDRHNLVDLGIYFFIAVSLLQLLESFGTAPGLEHFHQNSRITWGKSNYVAGVLVIAGLLIIVRGRWLRRFRTIPLVVACVAFIAAILTLSRGGTVALAAGVVAAVWVLPRTGFGKFLGRTTSLAVAFAAVAALDFIQAQRGAVNGQVYRNFDERLVLFSAAWDSFVASPLWGTGWAGLRAVTENSSTFAHNVFLSFLQIGGLVFGIPVLAILAFVLVLAARSWPSAIPVVVAIVVFCQTDPFAEGTVGGILLWMTAALAVTAPPSLTRPGGARTEGLAVDHAPRPTRR